MKYSHGAAIHLFDIVDGGDGCAMVVGIAESAEYAPSYRFVETPKPDAGVLVVFEDGSLKWRPLPGMPLILCEPDESQRMSAAHVAHSSLPAAALPAYHGCYVNGQRVELLDFVRLHQGETGRVVAIIADDLFSPGFKAEDWAYLKFGFLVESSQGGLNWFKDADEDLELLSRARE